MQIQIVCIYMLYMLHHVGVGFNSHSLHRSQIGLVKWSTISTASISCMFSIRNTLVGFNYIIKHIQILIKIYKLAGNHNFKHYFSTAFYFQPLNAFLCKNSNMCILRSINVSDVNFKYGEGTVISSHIIFWSIPGCALSVIKLKLDYMPDLFAALCY